MRALAALLFSTSPAFAAECDFASSFPCSVDDSYYTISIDAIQSTISKESLEINLVANSRAAEAVNHTDEPLYTITDQPAPGMPKFVKDKKTWYITSRISNTGDARCVPKTAENISANNVTKVEWDCSEHRDTCGKTINRNVLKLPNNPFPEIWYDRGLKKPEKLPPVTNDRTVQFLYFKNSVEKITTAAVLTPNDEHLKIQCKDDAKMLSCGPDCAEFRSKGVTDDIRWNSWKVILQIGPEKDGKQVIARLLLPTAGEGQAALKDISASFERALDQLTITNSFPEIPIDYMTYYCAFSLYLRMHSWLEMQPWRLQLKRVLPPSS